ncbi:hypothetical protein EPUS_04504 [Endocarpon pusillum Z07020]|uniref:Uncharacterized protein n=1 Tax=Endocarpon pusillum (strain Z07020 / HMAS-L-300199) TaxID=1263415 RepID=U1FVJ8_ENDPU|nr:uncharacterized protein EPUS_04504 [Endocarpon pusillum Z07020]ERF68852.1 hypothetical protein EPUS_04504 [Endocarpon pusillum Z07020]
MDNNIYRWNHDIPNKYFTDPRYNDGSAFWLSRQDSGESIGSSHSSDSHYSSYSGYPYNGAPAYYEQMQQAAIHGYPNNSHISYIGSSSSSAPQRPTASTRHDPTSFSSSSSKRERFYLFFLTVPGRGASVEAIEDFRGSII